MQAGLLNTYQHPVSNRSWLAWSLSALLFVAYILLYFGPLPALGLRFDVFQRAAEVVGAALGLPAVFHSKWILYGDRLHAGHDRRRGVRAAAPRQQPLPARPDGHAS